MILNSSSSDRILGPYYFQKKTHLETLQQRPIVMIGDSITDGCEWSELLNRQDISNRGIGGDTTFGVLGRIESILKMNPQKAFLMIGTNDLSRDIPASEVIENTKLIINGLQKINCQVFVQSILFVKSEQVKKNQDISIVNKAVKDACETTGAKYIDLNTTLAPQGFLDPSITNDGLHLMGDGYQRWKKEIEKYL